MGIHHQQTRSIQTLLLKEMNRREFLMYLGTLFLLVTGVSGLMKALHDPVSHIEPHTQTSGFGYGPYGGKKGGVS